jgi:hypothetical protein
LDVSDEGDHMDEWNTILSRDAGMFSFVFARKAEFIDMGDVYYPFLDFVQLSSAESGDIACVH